MRPLLHLTFLSVLLLAAAPVLAAPGLHDPLDDGPAEAAPDPPPPPGTRILRDLAYGEARAQHMDVYIPAHADHAPAIVMPVIVMVHGGFWALGDKASAGVAGAKMAHWVGRGMIFVSVNYRLLREADPVTQAADVGHALAAVQARAAGWGGDPARILLVGHSAGAHLVAFLAADAGFAKRQGAKPWLGTVSLDSAALDVVEIMQRTHLRFYNRVFGDKASYWRQASPLYHLTAAPAPMLLVCSTRRTDSCPPAKAFAAKAAALGGRVSLLPVEMTHHDINHRLGEPGAYTEAVDGFLASLGLP
ncbi:alpha/beta hydrolase [Ferrovibrio xuzhouensis]|uniref:Alpha/beta hydrolase n=1 Tax=Ferrovibrio xuzhouensis TaxID=1576914 RepID=A0ABV7VFU5_9PROT